MPTSKRTGKAYTQQQLLTTINLLEEAFGIYEWDLIPESTYIFKLGIPEWDNAKKTFSHNVGMIRVEYGGRRVQLGYIKNLQTREQIEAALIEANNEGLRIYDEVFQLIRTMQLHVRKVQRKATRQVKKAQKKSAQQGPPVAKTVEQPIQQKKKTLPKLGPTLLQDIRSALKGE